MKISKRRRTAKKLILPAIALVMMVSATMMGSRPSSAAATQHAPRGAAARFAHDIHQR